MNPAQIVKNSNEAIQLPDEFDSTKDQQITSRLLEDGSTEITFAKKGYGVQTTKRPLSAVRLELTMDSEGVNQTQLAAMTGISQTTISRIVSGETANSKHLTKIAAALNKNANWLAGLDQTEKNTATISGNNLIIENSLFLVVPRFKLSKDGQNGHIIGRDTEKNDTRMLLSSSIPDSVNKDDMRFFTENERAMNPIINAGSTVFFELHCAEVSNGNIYAVLIGNQVSSRFLYIQPNGDILMRAKESDFPDFTISSEEVNKYVLGKVIFVINKLS